MGHTEHNGLSTVEIARGTLQASNDETERTGISRELTGTGRPDLATDLSGCEKWQWINCKDGKLRPIEPGILPLAHGIPKGMVYSINPSAPIDENATQEARATRLKGYGNAIVPQVAAAFISAFVSV